MQRTTITWIILAASWIFASTAAAQTSPSKGTSPGASTGSSTDQDLLTTSASTPAAASSMDNEAPRASTEASAKTEKAEEQGDNPLERSFGIGYDVDLQGITGRYMISPDFGLDLTLGFGVETKTQDGEDTKFDFGAAVKAVLPVVKVKDRFRLNVTPGIYMQYTGVHTKDADGAFNLSIFGGLAPELFIWDGLAVEVMFGLAINLNRLNEPNNQKFYLNTGTIGDGISIISGLLFHYYFE